MLHSSPVPYLFTVVKEIISQLLLNSALRVSVTACACEKIEKTIKTQVFFQKEHHIKDCFSQRIDASLKCCTASRGCWYITFNRAEIGGLPFLYPVHCYQRNTLRFLNENIKVQTSFASAKEYISSFLSYILMKKTSKIRL